MQAAELCGVGVGFVARVDDRAVEGRLKSDLVLDEVGALGHLEARYLALLPAPDPARATDHGSGNHERDQATDDGVQVGDARHLIVLVGPVGRALAVRIVLHQDNGFLTEGIQTLHDASSNDFARPIPQEGVARPKGLRSRVFRMCMVHVESRAVGKHRGRCRR